MESPFDPRTVRAVLLALLLVALLNAILFTLF
jgi:hypothetical protein